MGNDNQKGTSSQPISAYSQIQKQQHPFLGSITHLSHQSSNSKHILKLFKYATQQQLMESLKRANKRKDLCKKKGSVNILRTTQVLHDKNNQLCGITYYLYIVYEDFNASLGDLIRLKQAAKQGFTEQEVLEMLRSISNAMVFLNDHGFKNYTISKQTVVKGLKDQNNNSMFKLFDTELAREMPPYQKLLNHIPIQKGIYLAPETLQDLISKNSDPQISLKSDIYTLGMITLEMCLLDSLDYFYDYEKYKVKSEDIFDRVSNLQNYSVYLKAILREMLQPNEDERIGVVTLREKLLINDNKSTTDYGYSAFGNSNVTQRTQKLSYPNNNVRQAARINVNDQASGNIQLGEGENQRIPRILTAENIKFQNSQPISFQNIPAPQTNTFAYDRRNQTFDNAFKPNYVQIQDNSKMRNKSSEKLRLDLEQQRKRSTTLHNTPFYYPPHIKPMSVPISHIPPSNLPPHPPKYYPPPILQLNTTHSSPYFLPNNTYQFNSQLRTNAKNNNDSSLLPPMIPLSAPKVAEIEIHDNFANQDKSQPQTPINNLRDSNTLFISDPLSLQPKSSTNSDDLSVLNSFNVGFKKAQSKQQSIATPILETKIQCESPERPKKNPSTYPASNQSTPIRKVQALQSHNRNGFNQIIKESEQQQNEFDNQINQKKILIGQGHFNGPKNYGKHHFTSGAVYQGEFDNTGNFCGNGVLYYPNGKICYSGGWVDNSFHGFGVLNNEVVTNTYEATNYQNFNLNNSNAWHHYEGQFCMDKKNGFGTLYMCNGDKFSGCFVKDLIEGYGTFTNSKGERISGIWSQNLLRKL